MPIFLLVCKLQIRKTQIRIGLPLLFFYLRKCILDYKIPFTRTGKTGKLVQKAQVWADPEFCNLHNKVCGKGDIADNMLLFTIY